MSCGPNFETLDQEAEAYERAEDYKASIRVRTLIIASFPNDINSFYNRGVGYHALAKYDSAIIDYQSVLSLDSLHLETNFNLGALYQMQGDFEKSIFFFSQILNQSGLSLNIDSKELNSAIVIDLMEVRFQRGNSYLKIRNFQKAIKDYESCITEGYKSAKAKELLSYSLDQMKK